MNYSETQLPVVSRITALKDMRFSLATISEIMGSYTDQEALKKYLMIKQQEVYEEQEEVTRRLRLLETTINQLGKYAMGNTDGGRCSA